MVEIQCTVTSAKFTRPKCEQGQTTGAHTEIATNTLKLKKFVVEQSEVATRDIR